VEVLRVRGGGDIIESADVTCGLSLGEYTALAYAGAFRYLFFFFFYYSLSMFFVCSVMLIMTLKFSFEDGLKLVKLRGEAMQVRNRKRFPPKMCQNTHG
jgi:malonyl CoA-acyl carrier protein transacylase